MNVPLYLRSLVYDRRTNLAVALGAAVGCAVLSGALIVGDSMRGSLRDLALARLGRVETTIGGGPFFRGELVEALAAAHGQAGSAGARKAAGANAAESESAAAAESAAAPLAAGLIQVRAVATAPDSGRRAGGVSLYGVDEAFARFGPEAAFAASPEFAGRVAVITDALAEQLGVSAGDALVLRFDPPGQISRETLLGRRERTPLGLRVRVLAVAPAASVAGFSTQVRAYRPANAFVPLDVLQRLIDEPGRVNLVLSSQAPPGDAHPLRTVADQVRLEDLSLRLRRTADGAGLVLESEAMLIPPAIARTAPQAADAVGLEASPVITYLADEIALVREQGGADRPNTGEEATAGREAAAPSVPYSTVAAIEADSFVLEALPSADSAAAPELGAAPKLEAAPKLAARTLEAAPKPEAARTLEAAPKLQAARKLEAAPKVEAALKLRPGQILLNEWAAEDLGAAVGDRVRLEWRATDAFGALRTESAVFEVAGIVALRGAGADATFTPPYPGVTDAERIGDWDPPFPIDLNRVRERDDAYWDAYRATPKAFIALADGLRLWGEADQRLGRFTSIRLRPAAGAGRGAGLDDAAEGRFARALIERVDLDEVGLVAQPLRAAALGASQGTTDFGWLFIGFSFFLIASAAMLVALLFRLGVERRARQVGLLLAVGKRPAWVRGQLLAEGALVAGAGCVGGLGLAGGYAWLMLAGLRTWWAEAAGAPLLRLHVEASSVAAGLVGSFGVALAAIALSLRGLLRHSPRALLAGAVEPIAGPPNGEPGRRRVRGVAGVAGLAIVATVAAVALAALAALERLPQAAGFFGSGAALLIGMLALARVLLAREPRRAVGAPGPAAIWRLGARNARRRAGRSLLTVGLIASAVFLVLSLAAFRLDPASEMQRKDGGAGGYRLYAEATTPIVFDLNSPAGRDALGLSADASRVLDAARVTPYRLRPGDVSSCLNLYRPVEPRLLGAPAAAIRRGGFRFAQTMADSEAERANPWLLLERELEDGAVPAIGDQAAVVWQWGSGLGQEITIRDGRGRAVRLRFVALLAGSALQDELVVSERAFGRMFPAIDGYGFFLIDTPAQHAEEVARVLEASLEPFGVDVRSTAARLRAYLAVQNTYITTFQTLGGLGLVLGTLGLGAVIARNVWERRGELALLSAVGFARRDLARLVFAENALLVAGGVVGGAVPAGVALAPSLAGEAAGLAWGSVAWTLVGIVVVGLGAGRLVLAAALRGPLVPALRAE